MVELNHDAEKIVAGDEGPFPEDQARLKRILEANKKVLAARKAFQEACDALNRELDQ